MCSIQPISIHAPRVGSDRSDAESCPKADYFNPRSPRGERPVKVGNEVDGNNFNPRSPRGERPQDSFVTAPIKYFNPRSPRGERQTTWVSPLAAFDFNPRSPRGERQQRCTDFSFASSAKRVFFCDILQIGRHLQGIGRKRRGDFLSRSVRTSRGKYGYLAFAFRESGGLRANRRFYSQSVLFSFRIDCQGSRIADCPFRGP